MKCSLRNTENIFLFKEYIIYQRHSNAKSCMIHTFTDIISAKVKLNDIVATEEERRRPYFADNDFFNKFSHCSDLYYLSILEQNTNNWNKYSENQAKIKKKKKSFL